MLELFTGFLEFAHALTQTAGKGWELLGTKKNKDEDGNDTQATVVATFDGSDLVVTECELVESLVGKKTAKPGEILYKFIDELKNSGHIKRTFTIAPWRLCFVERDGVRKSLEELRSTIG